MLPQHSVHNRFKDSLKAFNANDPHLLALSKLKYQYSAAWWENLPLETPGIYILTGGRQVGKSTSCKRLIQYCLTQKKFSPEQLFYLPCDEIYDATQLSNIVRKFLATVENKPFLLIIDEITFVNNWDRVIKALGDEGWFSKGLCLLTGSDTLILKDAAMRFPGRRGNASQADFHIYPLSFRDYALLRTDNKKINMKKLDDYFNDYLKCGGYLRAINNLAEFGDVSDATFAVYEQWIRGDFLKQGKREDILISLLQTLLTVGVSQISYSKLTQKMGLVSKETCINYCHLLARMDVLFNLQAFDQNKRQGFPRKDRKFHFLDPFIINTLQRWVARELAASIVINESNLIESIVASHCYRQGKTFYFKGSGEIDVIMLEKDHVKAIEVKWANQIRPNDLAQLKNFKDAIILTKAPQKGLIENIHAIPVPEFLFNLI